MARPTKSEQQKRASSPKPVPRNLVTGLASGSPASGRGPNIMLQDTRIPASTTSIQQALATQADDLHKVRVLAKLDPDTSNALSSMVRLANTPVTLAVYDAKGQVSPEGLGYLRLAMDRLFDVADYTQGFDDRVSFDGLVESLLREVPLSGASAAELVLDANRLPQYVVPCSAANLRWRTNDKQVTSDAPLANPGYLNGVDNSSSTATPPKAYKIVPYQLVVGRIVVLDIPNFFYAPLDKDPLTPYSSAVLETDIKSAIYYESVINDILRAVRMTGHSRLDLELDIELLKQSMPEEVKGDSKLWEQWFERQRKAAEDVIRGLEPEQGFAHWNYAKAQYLNSQIGAGSDYSPFLETLDGRRASALKTPPAVLSKRMSAGSQNTSSTEALLYLQMAEAIQTPAETVLSRLFTMAIRLYGFAGRCKATFEKPSLRPDIELAAFRAMDQTTALNSLSLGFITDDECAVILGTGPRSPDAPKLSGTMFMHRTSGTSSDSLADPTSNADPVKRAVTGNLPADTPSRATRK